MGPPTWGGGAGPCETGEDREVSEKRGAREPARACGGAPGERAGACVHSPSESCRGPRPVVHWVRHGPMKPYLCHIIFAPARAVRVSPHPSSGLRQKRGKRDKKKRHIHRQDKTKGKGGGENF